MSVFVVMIAISLLMACCFLAAFIWAARSGQFDDAVTPGMRILHEQTDEMKTPNKEHNEGHV